MVLLTALPVMGQSMKCVDFQQEVRPILSDACFHCHGPDKASRMAGLRLDTQEGALGQAIVSGKLLESKLYQRLTHANAALRMPPASAHKVITEAHKQTLKAWIEQGASWKEHWAFKAPEKAAVPAGRNPVDYFVRARLEAER